MSSWIKLYHKLKKWQWYDDIPTKVLFIHLLLSANYQDKQWRGMHIKPGQMVTGRKKLAIETGLSEQQVRRAIKNLEGDEITSETTNQFTVITLLRWKEYQSKQPTNNQQTTNEQPAKEPTGNQRTTIQTTTTKEYKNKKKEKNIKNSRGETRERVPAELIKKFGKKQAEALIELREDEGFDLPPRIEPFLEEFLIHKKKHRPIQAHGIKIVTNKMKQYTSDQIREVLDYTITGGYPGLYWDRVEKKQKHGHKITPEGVRRNLAGLDG